MNEIITVVGNVATDPERGTTPSGVEYLRFRIASDARRKDPASGEWVDGDANWYTVNAYRALAENAGASVRGGDRVIVHGRLRLRAWQEGERRGISPEIIADALGPDLRWGTTTFHRARRATQSDPDADAVTLLGPEDPDTGVPEPATAPGDDVDASADPSAVPVPF